MPGFDYRKEDIVGFSKKPAGWGLQENHVVTETARFALVERNKHWIRAVLAYTLVNSPANRIHLRSNLHKATAKEKQTLPHKNIMALGNRIFSNTNLAVNAREQINTLITPSASPRVTNKYLGEYADLRLGKLISNCPFKYAYEPKQISNKTKWLEQSTNENIYSYKSFELLLKLASCEAKEDWWADEPYFALSSACLKPESLNKLLASFKAKANYRITVDDFDVSTHVTSPGKNINPGDNMKFDISLIKQDFNHGLLAWSMHFTAWEEDLFEQKKFEENLNLASDCLSSLAFAADITAVALVETGIGPAIAEAVASACRLTACCIDLAVTLSQLFTDNDDYLGYGILAENRLYLSTSHLHDTTENDLVSVADPCPIFGHISA